MSFCVGGRNLKQNLPIRVFPLFYIQAPIFKKALPPIFIFEFKLRTLVTENQNYVVLMRKIQQLTEG